MNRCERALTVKLNRLQVDAMRRCEARGHIMAHLHSFDFSIRRWQCARCNMQLIVQHPPSPDYGAVHGVALHYDCTDVR